MQLLNIVLPCSRVLCLSNSRGTPLSQLRARLSMGQERFCVVASYHVFWATGEARRIWTIPRMIMLGMGTVTSIKVNNTLPEAICCCLQTCNLVHEMTITSFEWMSKYTLA